MADQPLAADEPYTQATAVLTSLDGPNVATAYPILDAPETAASGGGAGGTTAHGFVT